MLRSSALRRKRTGCDDEMNRRLHILNCWPRLPRQFPSDWHAGLRLEKEQICFVFCEVYLARWKRPTFRTKGGHTKMQREGRLLFCSQRNRWNVHGVYDKPIGLHCGECFEIQVGQSYLPCRIELDKEWYVVFSNSTIFHLSPKAIYNVKGI